MSNKEQYKVILLGDTSVGKTSLLNMKLAHKFEDHVPTTIGAAFKNISIKQGDTLINLQIWDTAGQERYRSLTRPYYRNAHAAIIVFDLSNPKTLDNVGYWLSELSQQQDDCIIVLVGNKSDLPRKVPHEMILNIMNTSRINKYLETSAKSGFAIDQLFTGIAEMLHSAAKANLHEVSLHPTQQQHDDILRIKAGVELGAGATQEKGCC